MIRVILQGRTGNNLFQYAAGRALAHRHQTELVLDGAWANEDHARQFEQLLRLPLAARYQRRNTLIKRAGQRLFGRGPAESHRGPVLIESSPLTPPDLAQAADGSLLIGFFQSARHFAGIETELRCELDLAQLQLSAAPARFEDTLRSRPTISIHVRRGDYLAIGSTQCLGGDYHQRAIAWFRERFEDLRFCLFSDDIAWCRRKFEGPDFLFCDFPDASADPLHDMRLMAACQHHIIVNSSYSWWGAWLNPSQEKQVIAPLMWMKNLNSLLVVPPNWIRT